MSNKNKNKVDYHGHGGYIFADKEGGGIEYIGDFDSLYKNVDDPWNQSLTSAESPHTEYYLNSRSRLIAKLRKINPNSLIEVGCGTGDVTQLIRQSLPTTDIIGVDISSVAIRKARERYPDLNFYTGDIGSTNINLNLKRQKENDVLVLSHLLWYVVYSLPKVFDNCYNLLKSGGRVVFSQSFLKTPQLHGAEICNGYDGFISYLNDNIVGSDFEIEYAHLDDSGLFLHEDGLIVLQKKS